MKKQIKNIKDVAEVVEYVKNQTQTGKPIDKSKMKGIKIVTPL